MYADARVIAFTVLGKAEPAGSKRAFYNQKLGRAMVVDANSKAAPWKSQVAKSAVDAFGYQNDLLEGPLALEVDFYEPRPKGHFNSRGELNAAGRRAPFPTKKPDATKLLRGVEDAMTGIVWRDDAQVVWQRVTKNYGEPARCEVRVSLIPPGGGGRWGQSPLS